MQHHTAGPSAHYYALAVSVVLSFSLCGCPNGYHRPWPSVGQPVGAATAEIGLALQSELPSQVFLPPQEEVRIRYTMSLSLMEEREYNEALQYLEWLGQTKPLWWVAHLEYAYCLLVLAGDYAVILSHLKESVRLKPANPRALHLIGIVHEDTGNFEKASESFKAALEIRSDKPETWYHLAHCLRKLGQLDEAISALRKVLELRDDPLALLQLANLLEETGRLDEAEQAFLKLARIHHDPVVAYQYLAEFYERTGQKRKARKVYKKIHVINEKRKMRPLK